MAVKIHVLAISKQKCKCVKVQGGITQNDMRGIRKKGNFAGETFERDNAKRKVRNKGVKI